MKCIHIVNKIYIQQVEYAKFVGPKVLRFFEKTFKVKYPLPKMDMIAIPDFSAGAMENWGNYQFALRFECIYEFQLQFQFNSHRISFTNMIDVYFVIDSLVTFLFPILINILFY